MPTATPRILICRLSAVGDVLHGLPVLTALREAFPQAFLAWVVDRRMQALLEDHPALDELIVVSRRWLRSPREVWHLRRRLRQLRFDISIDLQGLSKSAIAAWLSGAKRRIGFGDDNGRELSRWLNNERVRTTGVHIIDRNLELLRPLGVEHPAVRFDFPEAPADARTVEAFVQTAGLQAGFAILNPGAGWPSKLWPWERFAAVARHLGEACRLPSAVVWAGAQERQWAEQIVAQSAGHARLAPSTTLRELAALARRARLFVGSDTGPLHLAVAVGTPCVGLYGPMSAERNGPYGRQHIALQKMWLDESQRNRRNAPSALMEAIDVDDVCRACEEILGREGQRGQGTA
jgi:lipopolysaccharide heptosyltransferase I